MMDNDKTITNDYVNVSKSGQTDHLYYRNNSSGDPVITLYNELDVVDICKTNRSYFVVVSLSVEGLHKWTECPFLDVSYLKDLHRHVFEIKVVAKVEHVDRDIEIIKMKHDILDYLTNKYFDNGYKCCNFNKMSCEAIAEDIISLKRFNIKEVSVLEDGENGAIIKQY